MRSRMNAIEGFRMSPGMADATAEYILTLLNNLDSDERMNGFLSQDEVDTLMDAMSIAEDVADALRHPDKWGI